jgi:hypothetical protein
MATFKVFVNPKQMREDKTFRVYIRLTHKRVIKPITTEHYVTKSQLDKNFNIKDSELDFTLTGVIKKYRNKCDKLSIAIAGFDCEQLRDYLLKPEVRSIDYISWVTSQINAIKVKGSRDNAWIVLRSFIDFVGPSIDINEISYVMILKYDKFIRSPRVIKRENNPGVFYDISLKGVTDTGVKDYTSKLKKWYVDAMKYYNDRGNVLIPYNPFDKYIAPKQLATDDKNLEVKQLFQLFECGKVSVGKYNRSAGTAFAKDVAMLSFYLVGMNAVDLYNVDSYENGRIRYNRAKTSSRRTDNAYISIKVEPEAKPLVEKYRDPDGDRVFCFYKMYNDHDGLTKALNAGLAAICIYLKLARPITFIWLRYSWANIARNDCRVPVDDVGEALNHSDNEHKVTDIYLSKDWSIIDNANRLVLDYLKYIKGRRREVNLDEKQAIKDFHAARLMRISAEEAIRYLNSSV